MADMCGFTAAFLQPDSARLVRTMIDRIGHRGPDATWFIDMSPQAELQLGNLRLSIIDLSTAVDQPFVKDGLHLSYNGKLYNHRELRDYPGSRGVRLDTESDTEVVLGCWAALGPGRPPGAPRNACVRALRRAVRCPYAGAGSARHQADVSPDVTGRPIQEVLEKVDGVAGGTVDGCAGGECWDVEGGWGVCAGGSGGSGGVHG